MRIKQMTNYMLKNNLRIVALYLGVVAVLLFVLVAAVVLGAAPATTLDGGVTSTIFLFVLGIVSFFQFLKVGFSCSISRRTVFLSLIVSGLVLAGIIGLLDLILTWVVPQLLFEYAEPFASYRSFFVAPNAALMVVGSVGYHLAQVLVALIFGYFVGGLYYRMNRGLRIAVSVGVPVALFVVPSVTFSHLTSPALRELLMRLNNFVINLMQAPFHHMLFALIATAVFTLFLWLLMRRAPVKEN